MINIQQNVSLLPYNSFNIEVFAEYFIAIQSIEDLQQAVIYSKENKLPLFILNGGSNILFTQNVKGLTLLITLKGIKKLKEDDKFVWVEAQAGENWNDFVQYCINENWGGLENLSLIPGNVGTSPMQNIGAYGVEIKDNFHQLEAIKIETLETAIFTKDDCNFGYRESYFKQEGKGKYIITSVTYKLTKPPHPLHLGYGAIKDVLANENIENPTISDVSKAVISIRESKLPNPIEIGNAGSFFKNPVISVDKFKELKNLHPSIPNYAAGDKVKIPAGWLIEQAGWKGYRKGNYGVYNKQALILVNYGGASGKEIYQLSEDIIKDVESKFGVHLEREVNIY